jgi:hypothetical protein
VSKRRPTPKKRAADAYNSEYMYGHVFYEGLKPRQPLLTGKPVGNLCSGDINRSLESSGCTLQDVLINSFITTKWRTHSEKFEIMNLESQDRDVHHLPMDLEFYYKLDTRPYCNSHKL